MAVPQGVAVAGRAGGSRAISVVVEAAQAVVGGRDVSADAGRCDRFGPVGYQCDGADLGRLDHGPGASARRRGTKGHKGALSNHKKSEIAEQADHALGRSLRSAHRAPHGGRLRLLADKAYSRPGTRARLRALRVPCTIPERRDQQARRAAQGSAGGRPRAFDPAMYKKRNTIERGFNRTKQCRGIATRYDTYATTYLGGVLLNAVITYHRTH